MPSMLGRRCGGVCETHRIGGAKITLCLESSPTTSGRRQKETANPEKIQAACLRKRGRRIEKSSQRRIAPAHTATGDGTQWWQEKARQKAEWLGSPRCGRRGLRDADGCRRIA